jgi:hypothetical protein
VKDPLLTIMYSASKVRAWLSANINPPSTITVFKGTGEDSSTIIVYPFGTKTESPALGGNSPPQVISSLHKRPYTNTALVFTKELNPAILTVILASSVEDPLSPVVQVIAALVTAVTAHTIPSSVTSTSSIFVPNPLPLI